MRGPDDSPVRAPKALVLILEFSFLFLLLSNSCSNAVELVNGHVPSSSCGNYCWKTTNICSKTSLIYISSLVFTLSSALCMYTKAKI